MKLTRAQELALIDIGLQKLLEDSLKVRKPTKTTTSRKDKFKTRGWSNARRKAFSKKMSNVWAKKRKAARAKTS